jgi:hypothetical protein
MSCRLELKYWEIIADNLSKAGWSWGCVSTVDSRGRRIFIADAHRGDGQRFVVRADEKLTAFVELESAIRGCGFCIDKLAGTFSRLHAT